LRPNSLSDVKKSNKRLLYECIREQKQVTMTELEHITKLSRPTIMSLVHEMNIEEAVLKVGRGTSSGGRIPTLYGINARAAFAMGIDMEFPTVRMAVSDLDGNLVCSSSYRYPPDSDKDQVLSLLLSQVEELLLESQIDLEKLLGIGVGIPGVIDRKNSCSVFFERIRGWENVPICEILEQRFGHPVYLYNDVDLMACAERKISQLEDIPDMLYIVIRNGISMSIWMDGKLVLGEGGNAGRLGHMLVNAQGPECKCGSRGCLCLYTGARAMCDMYREFSGKKIVHANDLLSLADQGDSTAQRTLEISGHYLGIGIVNVANLFDISHVVVSSIFDPAKLLEMAEPALTARNQHILRRKIYVSEGKMSESQYALGGCLTVLERVRTNESDSLIKGL
jgi:predicted NBD/HSP70 family sugar kinase